jgi:hypothetical protein
MCLRKADEVSLLTPPGTGKNHLPRAVGRVRFGAHLADPAGGKCLKPLAGRQSGRLAAFGLAVVQANTPSLPLPESSRSDFNYT